MIQKNGTGGISTLLSQHSHLLLMLIVVMSLVLVGYRAVINRNDLPLQERLHIGNTLSETYEEDPILNYLGKTFHEIQQVLGEPYEQGFGDIFGSSNYLLYQFEEGFILFCSPEYLQDGIAVSILLGPGLVVLETKVGLSFQEINDILGEPDLGPGVGMDNFYYADYFIGETNHEIPDVFISFISYSMDSPTEYALIKWEAFNEEEIEKLHAEK